MISALLQLSLCAFGPWLAMYLQQRVALVRTLGAVFLCYLMGIVVANWPGFSPWEPVLRGSLAATVIIALPLILLSTDLRKWARLSIPTILGFGAAAVSAMLVGAILRVAFIPYLPEAGKIAAMTSAVYVGGVPNMVAVKAALGVSDELFDLTLLAETLVGGLYFLFLLSAAGKVYSKLLPPFERTLGEELLADSLDEARQYEAVEEFHLPTEPWTWKQVGLALACSAGIVGVSAGGAFLAPHGFFQPALFLLLTTVALALSFVDRLRTLPMSHETGHYLLLVFCTAAGMSADLAKMAETSVAVIAFVALHMVGMVALHTFLCKRLGVDRDTALITSVAAIYGPPFIGPVAEAIDNREVEVSGVIAGSVGLAIGNYVGLLMGWLL